jgi:hypothetical protein
MIVLVKRKKATNIVLSAQLVGGLNGINKVFNTPSDYKSGKINLLCNGQALHSAEDFSETGPNEITFVHFAPLPDYILRATYEEA